CGRTGGGGSRTGGGGSAARRGPGGGAAECDPGGGVEPGGWPRGGRGRGGITGSRRGSRSRSGAGAARGRAPGRPGAGGRAAGPGSGVGRAKLGVGRPGSGGSPTPDRIGRVELGVRGLMGAWLRGQRKRPPPADSGGREGWYRGGAPGTGRLDPGASPDGTAR